MEIWNFVSMVTAYTVMSVADHLPTGQGDQPDNSCSSDAVVRHCSIHYTHKKQQKIGQNISPFGFLQANS